MASSSSLSFTSFLTSHSNATDLKVPVSFRAFNFFPLGFFSVWLVTKCGGMEKERKFGTLLVQLSENGQRKAFSVFCRFVFSYG